MKRSYLNAGWGLVAVLVIMSVILALVGRVVNSRKEIALKLVDVATEAVEMVKSIHERAIEKGYAQYNPKTGKLEWLNKDFEYVITGENDDSNNNKNLPD